MTQDNNYREDSIFKVKSQKGFKARNALLDSGIKLIAEQGVNGFSISDLCKESNLKRTSFYSYFQSIDHYVNELSIRENSVFEHNFEKNYLQNYQTMKPGCIRMVLTLLQFYDLASDNNALWNRFVMKLFAEHKNTALTMLKDIRQDVNQGILDDELRINTDESETYAQFILASLSITFRHTELTQIPKKYGNYLIKMILRSGNVDNEKIKQILALAYNYKKP